MSRTLVLALCVILVFMSSLVVPLWSGTDLHLSQKEVLETQGLSVLLFHNSYHHVFGDQKMSGLEIILHGDRIATNGDVRLSPTPAQWDAIPDFQIRKRGQSADEVVGISSYPDYGLTYQIDVRPEAGGFRVAVQLDRALPAALVGKAGFNLEFLPSAYFGKSYMVGDVAGLFPRHADGPMEKGTTNVEPLPLAQGSSAVLFLKILPHGLRLPLKVAPSPCSTDETRRKMVGSSSEL